MAPADALWGSGETYERYVGRWSRLVAVDFLDWLAVEPGRAWLDVGCGTAALTGVILASCQPSSVHGIDPSEKHIAYAREHVLDSRATFETGGAGAANFRQFVRRCRLRPRAQLRARSSHAVSEFARVSRPDGIAAAWLSGTMPARCR
jgi:ubiquinone/menaquinone biosynthesis C-methylase UbiE